MAAQVLTDCKRGSSALAGGTHKLLGATRAYIAGGKDALCTGLEVDTGHNETLGIQLRNILELSAIWRQSDKDKNTRDMQFACLTGFCVLVNDCIQVVILALELNYLRIEAHFYLRRVERFVYSDLICG